MSSFGQRLRDRRKELGLTQEELGCRVGIQKSGVAKYENGRIRNVTPEMARKFAHALQISPHVLLGTLEEALLQMDHAVEYQADGVLVRDCCSGNCVKYSRDQWLDITAQCQHRRVLADLQNSARNSLQEAIHQLIDSLPPDKLRLLDAYLAGLRDK